MCWLFSVAGRVNKEDLRELVPILGLLLVVAFRAVVTDDLLLLIELPMRVVLLELVLTFGLLLVVTFRAVVTGDFLLLIELPMRAVLLELMLTFGLLLVVTFRAVVTGDFFSLMDLATLTVLFELTRLLELIVVRFPGLELTLTDEGLEEDLRALEVTLGRRVVVRLDVTLLGWRTLGLTVVLELLRLDGLEALTAVRDLVTREEVVDCVRALPALEDRWALGAAEVFLTGWLF